MPLLLGIVPTHFFVGRSNYNYNFLKVLIVERWAAKTAHMPPTPRTKKAK